MEEGGIVSLTWLPRASMTLQRPAMADGGAVSMNWLFRDCLVLHRPAVEESGVASPAWLPREWLALEKSTMEEGHSFPSLTLQSITTPGESSYERGEHSYTHLAFVLSGPLEANHGRGGEKLPQTGSSVPVWPCIGTRVSQFPQPVSPGHFQSWGIQPWKRGVQYPSPGPLQSMPGPGEATWNRWVQGAGPEEVSWGIGDTISLD